MAGDYPRGVVLPYELQILAHFTNDSRSIAPAAMDYRIHVKVNCNAIISRVSHQYMVQVALSALSAGMSQYIHFGVLYCRSVYLIVTAMNH